jgi:hypothetical protein
MYLDGKGLIMIKVGLYAIISISVFVLCCAAVQATEGSLLRIDGSGGWTKHLEAASGSTVYLVVLSSKPGDATLNERYPDGSIHSYNYFLQGYERLPIQVGIQGRHVFNYVMDGKESNSVIIDVLGTCAAKEQISPSAPPQTYIVPQTKTLVPSARFIPRSAPISLSRGVMSDPVMLQYHPVGAHIMNYQNGIVIPKSSSQYHFGKDFSLGTIDNNYPGTPFLLQYLSDP